MKCFAGIGCGVTVPPRAAPRLRESCQRPPLDAAITRGHARFVHCHDAKPSAHARRIANLARLRDERRSDLLQQVFNIRAARCVRREHRSDPAAIPQPDGFHRLHLTSRRPRMKQRIGKIRRFVAFGELFDLLCDARRPLVSPVEATFGARRCMQECFRRVIHRMHRTSPAAEGPRAVVPREPNSSIATTPG